MKFWLDKGVDGFRMDVIPFISKDQTFPDYSQEYETHPEHIYASGPKLHEYLQEMNREVLSKYDVMTVGEVFGVTLEQTPSAGGRKTQGIKHDLPFRRGPAQPSGLEMDPLDSARFKSDLCALRRELDVNNWNTVFLSNHDNPRPVSSFGDDSPVYRVPSAKVLATMLLTLKGTPFIYQGDELGMTNYPFTKIEEFDDIEVKNAWKAEVLTKRLDADEYLYHMRKTSRDHSRTPMQWDDSPNAGFTTADKPWLAVNPNYKQVNARQQLADQRSIYHYFRQLIELRKKYPAFVYGDYTDLDPENPFLFVYTRTLASDKFLVTLNFSTDSLAYSLPNGLRAGKLMLSNLGGSEEHLSTIHLEGWEARIYRL